MRNWKKLSQEEITNRVQGALNENVDFRNGKFLGVPSSHLDNNVFYSDAPFLKDAPYMTTMVANPNHIGCHTLGESEEFFRGTQKIERELIKICAEDILLGESNGQDGYVTSGGTEANIQALWMYRNYFIQELGAVNDEIAILCSEDTHYAVYKGANILSLNVYSVSVNKDTRVIEKSSLEQQLKLASANGKRHMIVLANMATTMFGSVDPIDEYVSTLTKYKFDFKIHIDGAFGGFIYPFTSTDNKLTFKNNNISSFTLDAHKLAQAPYGTGIFLCRKGLMDYVFTKEAQYVHGQDITLIGSRSGANAVAVWMILTTYGPYGWKEKINTLQYRTGWICNKLDELNMDYYRNPNLNIVTIKADKIPARIANEFNLVPDNHESPNWYKIVVMDHVTMDLLVEFYEALKSDFLNFNKNNFERKYLMNSFALSL